MKYFVLTTAIVLSGPSYAESVRIELDGTYILSVPFVFERIEIDGYTFRYDRSTDEIGDPWARDFPIEGHIEIDQDHIKLMHPRLSGEPNVFQIFKKGRHIYLARPSVLEEDMEVDRYALRKVRE